MSFESELNKKIKELKRTVTVISSLSGCKFAEEKNKLGIIERKKLLETWSGFVVDYKLDLDVAQITNYLYLGSQDSAQDYNILAKNGITHVLSVGVDLSETSTSSLKFKKVNLLDEPNASLKDAFKIAFEFIDEALANNQNNKIFIHCNAGYSRAPSIVIAYLMKTFGYSLQEALEVVKKKRNVRPNVGFIKQLEDYEKDLSFKNKKI